MKSRLTLVGSAVAGALALTLAGPSTGLTQGAEVAPVITINQGACDSLNPQVAYDLGPMELVNIWGDPDGEDGPAETVLNDDDINADVPGVESPDVSFAGDDGVFDESDDGFLAQDYDSDGVVEIGRDLNEDGQLTDDEFLGDDVNGDGALQGDEILVVSQQGQAGQGPFARDKQVWKANSTIDGADGEQLVKEQNNSMVVRQSAEQRGTVLACGEILDMADDGVVIVPLRAVEGSQYTGVGTIKGDSGEFAAFLLEGVTIAPPPTPTATPPPPPTDTPAPTNTPEPTATPVPPTNTPVEVTAVSTEVVTEVVTEITTEIATQTPTPA